VPQLSSEPVDEVGGTQSTAGLSRLKGVFKTFNGGVEVNALPELHSCAKPNVLVDQLRCVDILARQQPTILVDYTPSVLQPTSGTY